jgi:predicted CXXCH cytochrome family protein
MPAPATATPDLSNPWNARHQPPMLAASPCFRKSQGRLSCLTCHSPHGSLERNAAAYDRACARCHTSAQHKADTKSRACVLCHMPRVEAQPYLRFANHRIGVYAPADPMAPLSVRE